MGAYILRRLALMIPTLLGILVINFIVVQSAPGGPVEQMIYRMQGHGGESATARFSGGGSETGDNRGGARGLPPDIVKRIEAMYGFDKPTHERFWDSFYLRNGSGGKSFSRSSKIIFRIRIRLS